MKTRDKLLSALKANAGTWMSGEALSRDLSVSRAAISKHVRVLKEKGYHIEAITNKGYLLKDLSDRVLANEIVDGLDTRRFGKTKIVYFDETDSTNTQAKILAENGAPEGTLVIAEKQTEGRGRKGRSWLSPAGDGIYMSLIIRPDLPPSEAARIALLTAVSLAEALIDETRLPLRIKWPNDILVNKKKIAGILIEISSDMDVTHYVIVGLGLNVNTPAEQFKPELKHIATSVLMETGKTISRVVLIRAFLHRFEKDYETLLTTGFKTIIDRWRDLADIIDKKITVTEISRSYSGKVVDIDNDGALILKDDKGDIHRIISGDVSFL